MNSFENNTKPTFSVNMYDSNGDIFDCGIFLHFGDTCLKIGSTPDDLRELAGNITKIAKEIDENYDI